MPEPSTTEGRHIQGELKNLLEDDGPKALPPEGKGTPGASRCDFLIHAGSLGPHRAHARQRLRPRVVSTTSTAAATVEPTSTRRCTEATTPGVGDATTAGRIGALHPNHPVRRLSAGHTTGAVPDPIPNPDYHHQVFGGNKAGTVARGTDDDNLIIRNLPLVLLRLCASLAGASASCADLQLG
jgi:hypothetical protein